MGFLFGIVRNILAVIGLITVIIAIILIVAFAQLTKTPALEGDMHKIEFTSASQQEKYASDFEANVQKLKDDIKAAPIGGTVTVTFTEKEATAKILSELDDADIPVDVSDVWLNFTVNDKGEEVVQLLGKVDVGFATVTAGVEMEMSVDGNGEPKIVFSEVAIGSGFGIPQQAKDLIADAIPSEQALTDMINDLPIKLDANGGIKIENGTLTFTGTKTGEI